MKKKSILLVLAVIVVVIGCMLQGCGAAAVQQPEPTEPPEQPEPTENQEVIETEPVTDPQSHLLVTRFLMPHEFDRGGKSGWIPVWFGINIEIIDPQEVEDPEQARELYIDIAITPDAVANFNNFYSSNSSIKPIGYFKITDQDGQPVTSFDPPILMHLRYTYQAWTAAVAAGAALGDDGDSEVPRVFYLARNGDEWSEEWQEFTIDAENIIPPENEYSFGHLFINLEYLPDPNIGGPGD